MSVTDVDKNSLDRGTPQINHDGKLPSEVVRSANTTSTSYSLGVNGGTKIRQLNNVILYYDDQNRIIRVDGFISSLAAYPVSITAVYGYDVYVDILGLPKPT